jgi:hypothetical protein
MQTMMRVLVGLVGAVNLSAGLAFLVAPARMAKAFYVTPIGVEGMATLRADFPGFFIGAAVFALWGAISGRTEHMVVPLVLLCIVLAGRCVSLGLDGSTPNSFPVMAAEAAMIAVLLMAIRSLKRAA